MRAPSKHDIDEVREFDQLLGASLARWQKTLLAKLYDVNPLMEYAARYDRFDQWRAMVADRRLRLRHPIRWRARKVVRRLRRWLRLTWRRLDGVREGVARRAAPWIVVDDRDDW